MTLSLKKQGSDEECQCDFCPDNKTIKRKYLSPECPCNCTIGGPEKEMHIDGTCDVSTDIHDDG